MKIESKKIYQPVLTASYFISFGNRFLSQIDQEFASDGKIHG
jgi:hypothetical protein